MKRFFALTVCLLTLTISGQSYKTLGLKASSEAGMGNYSTAIALSGEAIAAAMKDKKASRGELLALRSEQASYYLLSEQVEKGKELFAPLLEELSGEGGLSEAEMNVRQNYGVSLIFLGMYGDALPQLLRVRELSASHRMKADDALAVFGAIAVCYQYQYAFAKSEEIFKEAASAGKRDGLGRTADYASMLGNFALMYSDMQVPDKAIELFGQAEKIFAGIKDTIDPRFSVFLSDYGTVLAQFNQFDKALNVTFRARNLSRLISTENSTEYASTLNNLGYIYSKMNRIIEAEQFYEACIRIKKTVPYPRFDSYLTSISNLMVFYSGVGRSEAALEMAVELERGLKSPALTDTLKRAVFANNLAIHFLYSDYERSQKYFKEALRYYAAVYGPGNSMEAEIYADMGTLFQVHGNYIQCAEYLNKAAAVFQEFSKGDDPAAINTLCNLALLLRNIERAKEAGPVIDRALDLSKKFRVTAAPDLEQLYMVKSQVCADLNQVKEAVDYFNRYLELKYGEIEQNFSYMTETEKMFFLDRFEQDIKNFYTTILSHIDQYPELIKTLLDFRLRTKAFLLNNLSKTRQALKELNDPLLNEKFGQLVLKRESVAKLMNFDTNEYPAALTEAATLKQEADLLEKEISLKTSGLARSADLREINWQSIQKQLLPGEAAIEILQSYLVYDKGQGIGTNYTYLIIKSAGDPLFVSIDRKRAWEDEVLTLYRSSIDGKKDEPDLYRRLWKAVDEKLAGVSTVYLSPDGIYNQLNLNTLYNVASKKYLLDEKNIHLLPSLRDIREIKAAKPFRPQNAVLVGNPKFDYDLAASENGLATAVASRGAFGFVLGELPGTKTELEVIQSTLEKSNKHTTLLAGVNANEHAVKALRDPDVLHIATHGFFLEDPKEEDLAGYSKIEIEYYKNPMMRSGIFFSGANKTYSINTANATAIKDFEDGMLTAYEAMNLHLDKTELVVLSACQTGLGKIKNGEGVYGLQRAFKLAGAKSIIMSLWPVSDDATRDLMIAFYSAWTSSGDLYAAFKEAQLQVRKKYPEPYYWGAFVLSGR